MPNFAFSFILFSNLACRCHSTMPESMCSPPMTSLTFDAIACREEEAVVVDYILKGRTKSTTLPKRQENFLKKCNIKKKTGYSLFLFASKKIDSFFLV